MFLLKARLVFLMVLLFQGPAKAFSPGDTVTTISIKAIGGLQYDRVSFSVKPGASVKVILNNADDMSHNLVFTRPGSRLKVVKAALALGTEGLKVHYVPKSKDVLSYIPVLAPGETKFITFIAPAKEGVYPYVCTYPGHGFVMYGEMLVSNKSKPGKKNASDASSRDKKKAMTGPGQSPQAHTAHMTTPYLSEVPPFLYRIFMPGAGPAAIAVNLPHNVSYCWDAGSCRLRYAWQGGFLDNTDIWKGHHDSYGNILGSIFFRDKTDFPFRIDEPGNIPAVQFKGYRLIDRYPEFHYTLNGIEVYELIKPKEDGSGLIRTFRIPKTNRTIWFLVDIGDGVNYKASGGKWIGGQLKLLPEEARGFTLIMTKK